MKKVIKRRGEDTVFAPSGLGEAVSPVQREGRDGRRACLRARPVRVKPGGAGSPHPQLQGKPGVSQFLLWTGQRIEKGHGTWGMWRTPGECRPAEQEAGAGRGLGGGRTWPAAALTAGGGTAPGRGTCGRAAAAASANLLCRPEAGRALALVLAHLYHGSFPSFTPLSPSSSGAPKWRRWGQIT